MAWMTGGSTTGLTLNSGHSLGSIPHAYDTKNDASDFYPNQYSPTNAAQFLRAAL